MKAGVSIKLILYFAPNCPRQIVAPNCPTPNCPCRIVRAELSAPNCPPPNCPDTRRRIAFLVPSTLHVSSWRQFERPPQPRQPFLDVRGGHGIYHRCVP